jgi:hypothetical protein
MSTVSAEATYKAFKHCLDQDVFPPTFMAGFFGMGGNDLPRVQPVLGVWLGLQRYGLLEKDAFKLAIREDKIGEFFEQVRLKLSAVGHDYDLKLQEINVFFDGLPPMGPEPPQDLVSDIEAAYIYAIDAYTMPRFQTPETQRAAWDKAENLLGQLMLQPDAMDTFKVVKMALAMYQEARTIYKLRRKTPAGLAELVRRLRVAGAVYGEELSSDSDTA